MKKNGITVTTIVIMVLVLLILFSTISVSITYSINNAKKLTFAKEIYNIQSLVNECISNEGVLPETTESIRVSPSDISQFTKETFDDGYIILEVIDLKALGVKDTVLGNKENGKTEQEKNKDVYVVSPATGIVYYVAGQKVGNEIYYTLTNELLEKIERKQVVEAPENAITFLPSTLGWSKDGISVTITVPNDFEDVAININNEDITYVSEVKEKSTVYTVNESKAAEGYVVTVTYVQNGKEKMTSYEAKVDNIAPKITVDETSVKPEIRGLEATDEQSGIRYFKYVEGVVNKIDAKEYVKVHGFDLTRGTINFYISRPYTLYAEDKAGNEQVMYIDVYGTLTNNVPEEIIIPEGFTPSIYKGERSLEDGLVIYKTSATTLLKYTHEKAQQSFDQFVWVPVKYEKQNKDTNSNGRDDGFDTAFARTDFENGIPTNNISSDNTEPSYYNASTAYRYATEVEEYEAMISSVYKYGGFYIGRYEAGDGDAKEARTTYNTGANTVVLRKGAFVYNYVGWGSSMTNISDEVPPGKGKGAVYLAQNMYEESDMYKTNLIYGVQWDWTLKWISDKYNVSDGRTWGNYYDSTGAALEGAFARTDYTCGRNEVWKAKNIYDLAGNFYEWTMEANTGKNRVRRGGVNWTSGENGPGERAEIYPTYVNVNNTFRPVLLLK